MDLSQPDFADARNRMVDGQIRPNKVTDRRILDAMRVLPRERFLPPALAHLAYTDEDVPLGGGRVLIEPMVIARLVQMMVVHSGQHVLVIAAGTGYAAALLAACGAQVTAVEEEDRLLAIARPALATYAPSVALVAGKLVDGWPGAAPYDAILIAGAVRNIPAGLAEQLRPEGARLVTVLAEHDGLGHAVLAEPSAGRLRAQAEFDCATPLLPQFMPAPAFVF